MGWYFTSKKKKVIVTLLCVIRDNVKGIDCNGTLNVFANSRMHLDLDEHQNKADTSMFLKY